MDLYINMYNINKNVKHFESREELLEFIKDKVDFLYRNNKNYNQTQWIVIQDLKEILDNINIESEA